MSHENLCMIDVLHRGLSESSQKYMYPDVGPDTFGVGPFRGFSAFLQPSLFASLKLHTTQKHLRRRILRSFNAARQNVVARGSSSRSGHHGQIARATSPVRFATDRPPSTFVLALALRTVSVLPLKEAWELSLAVLPLLFEESSISEKVSSKGTNSVDSELETYRSCGGICVVRLTNAVTIRRTCNRMASGED